jgi:hypothetical protein
MLVVEQLSAGYGHAHGSGSGSDGSGISNGNGEGTEDCNGGHSHNTLPRSAKIETQRSKNKSAMVGLIIHAAVDGVALGASVYAGAGYVLLRLHRGYGLR